MMCSMPRASLPRWAHLNGLRPIARNDAPKSHHRFISHLPAPYAAMLLAYPLTAGLLLLRIAIAVRNGMTG